MRKTLLLVSITMLSVFAVNAQTVWDFSTLYPLTSGNTSAANQGVKDNIGFFVNPSAATPVTSFAIDFSAKAFAAGGSYAGGTLNSRLKLGGKGSDASSINPLLPTTNYVYFNVTGPCTITVFCRSSSSTATDGRILYITNGTTLLGSYTPPTSSSDVANITTANYTGGAGVIYIYGYINAFNIYRIEATANVGTTGVIAGINPVQSELGVSFNGTEIVNNNGLNIEVYNVLGKKIAASKTSISTSNFAKGIYIVRSAGMNGSLKFSI